MQSEISGKTRSSERKYLRSRMNKVISYIQANLDNDLSVETLSRVANVSRFHFHREFLAHAGINVGRLVQQTRLKRASLRLVFNPAARITDVALDTGFGNPESFSRAFKRLYGCKPSEFRRKPDWQTWNGVHNEPVQKIIKEHTDMQVEIVDFPETKIAALEHHGPESQTYNTTMKFIEWRRENGIGPGKGNTYGIHYTDPKNTFPEDYRLDICVSVDRDVPKNPQGVVTKSIPGGRCAVARYKGSREYIPAAEFLVFEWLPESGEQLREFPIFFHYVNVGPDVKDHEMITDVYLPIK